MRERIAEGSPAINPEPEPSPGAVAPPMEIDTAIASSSTGSLEERSQGCWDTDLDLVMEIIENDLSDQRQHIQWENDLLQPMKDIPDLCHHQVNALIQDMFEDPTEIDVRSHAIGIPTNQVVTNTTTTITCVRSPRRNIRVYRRNRPKYYLLYKIVNKTPK
ncbi:uncharacterized protein LOC124368625 isoform X2 [Homalodisca vitripennis]|uniref:uncharacterized protein LOC124368625 isoform X2 n=1 Tax=Homalodisca vitripennis TaxID=197043 RepID=UPI001EEB1B20|nr:uncharacterized protein LOC124368625 isoform X2 [Homalodisca vitripennis]